VQAVVVALSSAPGDILTDCGHFSHFFANLGGVQLQSFRILTGMSEFWNSVGIL
jgi:hypothetical protein